MLTWFAHVGTTPPKLGFSDRVRPENYLTYCGLKRPHLDRFCLHCWFAAWHFNCEGISTFSAHQLVSTTLVSSFENLKSVRAYFLPVWRCDLLQWARVRPYTRCMLRFRNERVHLFAVFHSPWLRSRSTSFCSVRSLSARPITLICESFFIAGKFCHVYSCFVSLARYFLMRHYSLHSSDSAISFPVSPQIPSLYVAVIVHDTCCSLCPV